MVTVNLAQAKARLSELPDKVEAGQEVIITRHGKAVAHLSAAVRPRNRCPCGSWPGFERPCLGCGEPPRSCCARLGTSDCEIGARFECAISTPVSSFPSCCPRRSIRISLSCSFTDGTTATAISESADQNPRRRQFARHSLTNRRGGRRTRHSPTRRCFEVSPVI